MKIDILIQKSIRGVICDCNTKISKGQEYFILNKNIKCCRYCGFKRIAAIRNYLNDLEKRIFGQGGC